MAKTAVPDPKKDPQLVSLQLEGKQELIFGLFFTHLLPHEISKCIARNMIVLKGAIIMAWLDTQTLSIIHL